MDADTENYVQLFQSWLEKTCRVLPALARPLATEFVTLVGLTEIDQLQLLQHEDPAWLDGLKCNLPVLTRRLIVSCVEKIGRVPLHSLTVEDVSLLVHSCFAEFPYNQIFKENLISGFNLEYVNDVDTLKQFGIPHEHHAAALMRCIIEWRRIGVPVKLLSLSDEEHNRRIASIKEEKATSRASPAVPPGAASGPGPGPATSSSVNAAGAAQSTSNTANSNSGNGSGSGTAANPPSSAAGRTHGQDEDELSIISAPCRPDSPGGTAAHPVLLDSSDTQPSGAGGDTDDNDSVASLDADNDRDMDIAREPSPHYPLPAAATTVSLADVSAVAKRLLSPSSSGAPAVEEGVTGKRARTGTALPTHTLLSGDTLARFGSSSASSGSSGSQVASDATTARVTAAVGQDGTREGNQGSWENRADHVPLSEQVMAFVPNTAAKGPTSTASNNLSVVLPRQEPQDSTAMVEGVAPGAFVDVHNAISKLADEAYEGAVQTAKTGGDDDGFGFVGEDGGLNGAAVGTEKPIWTSDEDEVSVKDTSSDSSFKPKHGRHGEDDGTWDGDASSSDSSSSSESESDSDEDESSFEGMGNRRRSTRRSLASSGTSGRETRRSLSQRGATTRVAPNPGITVVEEVGRMKGGGSRGAASQHGAAGSNSAVANAASSVTATPAPPQSQRKKAPKHSVGSSSAAAKTTATAPPAKRHSELTLPFNQPNFLLRDTDKAPTSLRPTSTAQASSSPSNAPTLPRAARATTRALRAAATAAPPGLNAQQTKSFEHLRDKYCPAILNSRDEATLRSAVDHICLAAKKTVPAFVDEIVASGAFEGLLDFVHDAEAHKPTFIYHVLRTISLIVTRIAATPEIHLVFRGGHFKAILKACQCSDVFVRQQALHLISELGVNQDNGLKDNVLKGGAVKAIVQCYNNAKPFDNAKSIGTCCQVAGGLYKLASNSTSAQFVFLRDALPVLYELLTEAPSDGRWSHAVDAALAASFLTSPDHPEQIDALRSARIIDAAVAALQDTTLRDSVRWHCCGILWSVVKHCTTRQATGLYKLTAVLGQVFQQEDGDPHLRAAVLNTMQVLLTRGSVFVGQFINIRGGSFAGAVMETLRTYAYTELVPLFKNSDCIMKYAAFTLANAVLYADSDQLKQLLHLGAYPLLFKIIALDGEYDKPEEAKLKAIASLRHIFDALPEEVAGVQTRAERRKFNAQASWEMLRGIVGTLDDGVGKSSSSSEAPAVDATASPWSAELRQQTHEVLRAAEVLQVVT